MAIIDFDKAIQLMPDYSEAFNNRGRLHAIKGNYDLAINDYNVAIAINNTNAQAYYNRGIAFLSINKINEAIPDLQNACNLRYKIACTFLQALQNR